MKRIKRRKNSIEMIVGIYNRTLDFWLLFGSYLFQREMMK